MKNIFYEYKNDKRTVPRVFPVESGDCGAHFHRTIELIYCTSGNIDTEVGDERFTVEQDDIAFVHNYYIHSFRPIDSYTKIVIQIPANFINLDKVMKNVTLMPYLSDREFNRREILPVLQRMCDERDGMHPMVLGGYTSVICGLLFSHYETRPTETSSNMEFMVRVLHYIDEHYAEPLTLESCSAVFGYNKYYFSRLFNSYIGDNLSNYINVVRVRSFMSRAKECDSPQISRIAEECGFLSMPTFYRTFQKLYGVSPRTYFAKKDK